MRTLARWRSGLAFVACFATGGPASAQTLALAAEDTTLRGGAHSGTNFGRDILVTRDSDDPTYVRRALLKFDTHTTIPAGANIGSAVLTLTVRGGNDESRRLAAFCVPSPFGETAATWNDRKAGVRWRTPGGDTVHRHGAATVTNTAGSRVRLDVTDLVQEVVAGSLGSYRYTRILLVDVDPASRASYKEYYSGEAADAALRPVLTVTLNGAGTPDDQDAGGEEEAGAGAVPSTGSAAAGGALTLDDANATTLRGGSYAARNFGSDPILVTRASSSAEYVRRALLKFDTHTTIPAGTPVAKATLTLTVRGGNGEARQIAAYDGRQSYTESVASWTHRKSGTSWSTAGGSPGTRYATATVTNAAGSTVTFDVTALVRDVVGGRFDSSSRYTRIVLIDSGSSSRDSYKEYHSDEAGDPSVRPRLDVQIGGGGGTSSPAAPEPEPEPAASDSGSATLKVLEWNTHHGVGTDGQYNLDRIAAWIAKTGANVVSLNEVERFTSWGNEDQPARYAALLQAKTGRTWHYHFAERNGGSKGQGNLVLTTYSIASRASHLLSYSRSVAQVSIVVNGRTVNVFSTHLDADSSSRRATQMEELKGWAGTFGEQRVLPGDYNAWPGAAEIPRMTSTSYDAWAEAKSQGTAVAYPGNTAGNTRNSRIDYVFYSRQATKLVLKGARVFDTRDGSGVMPSDHRPVMATFEVR
jgi:endonuclease/exonuclease/phosphatase family metal-dependent hydrolase